MDPIICELYFEEIAKNNPQDLLRTIETNKMSTGMKARAISTIKYIADFDIAFPLIKKYLYSDQPIVQEGALIALEAYLDNPKAKTLLNQFLEEKNLNEIILEIAQEMVK